jgi:hypothetical protein
MFFPPINLTPQLDCPHCGKLTPKRKPRCVHCRQSIPENFRRRAKADGKLRRRQTMIAAAVLLPTFLIFLTWIFYRLGL